MSHSPAILRAYSKIRTPKSSINKLCNLVIFASFSYLTSVILVINIAYLKNVTL